MSLIARSEGKIAFSLPKDDETIKGLVKDHGDIVSAETVLNCYQKVAIKIQFKDGLEVVFDWDYNARVQRPGRNIPAEMLRVKTNTLNGYSCLTDRSV